MVPTNLYGSLDLPKKSSSPRLAFCHSGMLPWVADFIAEVSNSSQDEKGAVVFDASHVLELCRENARRMYLDA
jgi:TatD DNase family protein